MTCLLFNSLQYFLNIWTLNEGINDWKFCLAGVMVLEEKWGLEAGEGLEINIDLSNFWTPLFIKSVIFANPCSNCYYSVLIIFCFNSCSGSSSPSDPSLTKDCQVMKLELAVRMHSPVADSTF